MPSADVRWPIPLWRQHPWYPGQLGGVPGVDTETGLRAHSTGAVFYVDPNYPGVSDARDGTNPTNPLATVAQALTLCQAYRGDTIAVMANDSWEHGGHGQGYTFRVAADADDDVLCLSVLDSVVQRLLGDAVGSQFYLWCKTARLALLLQLDLSGDSLCRLARQHL